MPPRPPTSSPQIFQPLEKNFPIIGKLPPPPGGSGAQPPSLCNPWPRLLRLPNLLTLPGDILAGFLLSSSTDYPRMLPALAASACLYSAGLLYNDLADASIDAKERPDRPLPSGAVTPTAVRRIATALLLLGLLLAIPAHALPTAVLLALAILLYDFAAKKSPILGPPAMALCRSLNLLLGSAAAALTPAPLAAAALLGLYIALLTALARREADPTSRITPARIGHLLRLLLPLQTLLCLSSFLLPTRPPLLPALPLALLPLALYLPNRLLSRRFPPS